MIDARNAKLNDQTDEVHRFCKEVHRQTGVFIRVIEEEDFDSLAGLVKLSGSPNLLAALNKLHPQGSY